MNDRFVKACQGKSYSQGGLNVPDLKQICKKRGITNCNLSRNDLLKAICPDALGTAVTRRPKPTEPKPTSDFDLNKLKKACQGKSKSAGGLNLSELKQICKKRGIKNATYADQK